VRLAERACIDWLVKVLNMPQRVWQTDRQSETDRQTDRQPDLWILAMAVSATRRDFWSGSSWMPLGNRRLSITTVTSPLSMSYCKTLQTHTHTLPHTHTHTHTHTHYHTHKHTHTHYHTSCRDHETYRPSAGASMMSCR